MKTKFECRCGHKFTVPGDRANAICPKCRQNVSFFWQKLKPGDSIVRGGFK